MMKKICDVAERIQMVLGIAFLSIYIFCTGYQVVARCIPGMTSEFTEEIANYSFIWSAFTGAAIMLRENKHFSFNSIAQKFKGKLRYANDMLVMLILLAFSVMMTVHGLQLTMKFWNWTFQSLKFLKVGYAWACLPVSGFCCTLYSIEWILKYIKDPSCRKTEDEEELEKLDQELAQMEDGQQQEGGAQA